MFGSGGPGPTSCTDQWMNCNKCIDFRCVFNLTFKVLYLYLRITSYEMKAKNILQMRKYAPFVDFHSSTSLMGGWWNSRLMDLGGEVLGSATIILTVLSAFVLHAFQTVYTFTHWSIRSHELGRALSNSSWRTCERRRGADDAHSSN